jgi:hypothetical protein
MSTGLAARGVGVPSALPFAPGRRMGPEAEVGVSLGRPGEYAVANPERVPAFLEDVFLVRNKRGVIRNGFSHSGMGFTFL